VNNLRKVIKPAFYDADTDTDILVSFSLLQEIARVGRQDVGMSVESESVSASWNAVFTRQRAVTVARTGDHTYISR